jgi:type II secretory pathway component PulK
MIHSRRGFALLAVLWVTVSITALGFAVSLAATSMVRAVGNRTEVARATWDAEACAEQARAAISEVLSGSPQAGWADLDRNLLALVHRTPTCEMELTAAGARPNVNTADEQMLGAVLMNLAFAPARRDSLVAALLDWRDADDEVRTLGAERLWYTAHRRMTPRNGPFSDITELRRVRGFEVINGLDTLLGTEVSRIPLNKAPLSSLAALPGFGNEALSRMREMRLRNEPVSDLLAFAGQLSPDAQQNFLARYSELVRLTTVEPDAWILRARASSGAPPVTVVLELRLVRSGDRVAIVRVKEWTP